MEIEYSVGPPPGSCIRLRIQAHLIAPISYAESSVTKPTDIRDIRTDLVQALVDKAGNDPATRDTISQLLFADLPLSPPPGAWRAPTPEDRARAGSQCRAAAEAASTQLHAFGTRHLYTTLRELPEVRVEWHPLRRGEAIPPAPLVFSLVEPAAWRVLTTLAAYVFARHTRALFDKDVRRGLLRRLNAFAQLEINLWLFAYDAGHSDPPPYVVRYDLACWLWHPSIEGVIFCLRCGNEVHYRRRGRTHTTAGAPDHGTRVGRCRACSRGREDDWPEHALEPYKRGTWLLHCGHPGCAQLFVGRRQARHCEEHRMNRLTPRARGGIV